MQCRYYPQSMEEYLMDIDMEFYIFYCPIW